MIGILDLQGDVVEHLDHLERLGIPSRRVKRREDLAGLAGLILPGGESTCLSRLLTLFNLDSAIRDAAAAGMKLWGTCAGAILLAEEVVGEHPHLGLIDITVQRNGFGSQLDSFTTTAVLPEIAPEAIPLVFIRAPKILRVGMEVRPLLVMGDYVAAAESDSVLVTVFHPELTGHLAFHRYFALKCGLAAGPLNVPPIDPSWSPTSWTRYLPI